LLIQSHRLGKILLDKLSAPCLVEFFRELTLVSATLNGRINQLVIALVHNHGITKFQTEYLSNFMAYRFGSERMDSIRPQVIHFLT